jgi:Putative metallopeptidase
MARPGPGGRRGNREQGIGISLQRQAWRLETLLCLRYGTDPEAHRWLLEEGHLSAGRAGRCEDEYDQVQADWVDMLSEHVTG